MKWQWELNGHKVEIEETTSPTQGVYGMLARCRSCARILDGWSMDDYPKYRIAFNQARECVTDHAKTPMDDQDGVW